MADAVKCEQCGESFGNRFKLGQHRRYTHGGGKNGKPKPEAAVTKPKRERKAADRILGAASKFAAAIDELRQRRSARLEELARGDDEVTEIDEVILRLERLG